jgi:hypothetical protein
MKKIKVHKKPQAANDGKVKRGVPRRRQVIRRRSGGKARQKMNFAIDAIEIEFFEFILRK